MRRLTSNFRPAAGCRIAVLVAAPLLVGFCASAARASAGFVQAASGSTLRSQLKVAYPGKVVAGDLLVGEFGGSGAISVSDSVNGAWREAIEKSANGEAHSIWYLEAARGGATTVIVSGGAPVGAIVVEYSGVARTDVLDQTSCNQGTTSVATTGATGPVVGGDLLFAGVDVTQPVTVSAGSSGGVAASLRAELASASDTSAVEDVTSTAAPLGQSEAQDASFTLGSSPPSGWAACAAAFHSAASVLFSVSCPSARSCMAVGEQSGGPDFTRPLAERWNGRTWTYEPVPLPRDTHGISSLSGVSCSSPTACIAVGFHELVPGMQAIDRPFAERWNGSRWSLTASVPGPAGWHTSGLGGVSCPHADVCLALGSGNVTGEDMGFGQAVFAERWNGARWQAQPAPNPPDESGALAQDISCTSSDACTGVGLYQHPPGGPSFALIERWNGTRWNLQTSPDAPNSVLDGVSCTSRTVCLAVGSSAGVPVAERWNGIAWTVQPMPSPLGLSGVSCRSATACTAVGGSIAARWNGRSWTIQPTATPTDGLSAVSCPSRTACTAVGSILDNTNTDTPLAEHWDGTTWSIQPIS